MALCACGCGRELTPKKHGGPAKRFETHACKKRAASAANREKDRERNIAYRAANREKVIENCREYRAANLEKVRERERKKGRAAYCESARARTRSCFARFLKAIKEETTC